MKLSDAFLKEKRADADIEVRVRMLNINYGHNKKLMEACKPLSEYAKLIEEIRRKMGQKESMENAIDHAIDEMPEDSVILPFLRVHRMEVKEYDEAKTMERIRKEALDRGGLNMLFQLVEKRVLSIEIAAEQAGMSENSLGMS